MTKKKMVKPKGKEHIEVEEKVTITKENLAQLEKEMVKPKEEEHIEVEEKVTITKENLAQLEKRSHLADEYLDHLRRLKAEFENYKKREEKQRVEFIKWANEGLVTELLPVMDSLERALNGVQVSHNLESFLPGIELIRKQLEDVLVKNGLATIETIGKPFDPRVHEAMMHVESNEYPEETVCQELRKGYLFNGRVIRPAQVAVSRHIEEGSGIK